MAATPYTVSLTVANSAGQRKMFNLTASDVTTELWLLPSGANISQYTAKGGVISDIIVSAAGVDTSQVTVYVNGQTNGYVVYPALNLPTAVGGRQVQTNPIGVPAGAMLQFIQVT